MFNSKDTLHIGVYNDGQIISYIKKTKIFAENF